MDKGDIRNHRAVAASRGGLWSLKGGLSMLSGALAKATSLSLVRALSSMFEGATTVTPGARFPVYRVEPVLPLDVSSPRLGVEQLSFGDGAFFGEQPADSPLPEGDVPIWGGGDSRIMLYWVDLPRGVVSIGSRIGFTAAGSGSFLLAEADWFSSADGKSVGFVKDPTSYGTLWIFDSAVDHEDVFESFPFVKGLNRDDPEESARFAFAAMNLSTSGPTFSAVEGFVSAAAGQQITQSGGEILSVTEMSSGETIVEIGDEVIRLDPGTPPADWVEVGATAPVAGAVSSAVRVLRPPSDLGWWREFQSIPVRMPFAGGCVLVFTNSMSSEWPPTPLAADDAVSEFVESVEWGSAPSGIVNPAEFASEALVGAAAIPIIADLSKVSNISLFFSRVSSLSDYIPPSSVLVVSAFIPKDEGNEGLSATESGDKVSGGGLPIQSFSSGLVEELVVVPGQGYSYHRRF